MNTGSERFALAYAHEQAVAERFTDARCIVCPFGQAQISDIARDGLGLTSSPLRWMPDLLVITPLDEAVQHAYWVDAKAEFRKDTPNYSLEINAWRTHHWLAHAGIDVIIVWGDFRWSHAAELHPYDLEQGPFLGNGSGTPFVLVRKWMTHPWEELLP